DVDEGDRELALQLLEEDLHLLAQLQVERAERLVEEQDGRLVDDRTRQSDTLPLAAGELHRLSIARAPQAGTVEHLRGAGPARAIPLTRRPYSTFSATVMCGKRA